MVNSSKIDIPTTHLSVAGASALSILGAVASTKHRIFLLQISVDTAGLVTIADFTNLKVYLPANGTWTWDFGPLGVKQGTANTAITLTNAAGGNATASLLYKVEA